MEIKIDPEFRSLIPKISEDELNGLEESLLNEGCRDPLVLWDEILLDGHNRYEICTRHEIKFKTLGKTFDNRDQAKLWIICNQLSRRNLTPEDKTYLIGIQYKLEKKEHGGHLPGGKDQNDPFINTAEKIAEQHHISPATVKRAEKFADAVDKLPVKEKEKILSGESNKTKKDIIGSPPKKLKLGPPRNGMQFARIAIMKLSEIRDDDLEREEAFDHVQTWLNKKRKGGEGK